MRSFARPLGRDRKSRIYRRSPVAILLIWASICFGCGGANVNNGPAARAKATPDRGEEIVAEHLKRDAAPYRKDRVRFTIREEGEKTEIIEIDTWRRQAGDVTATLSIVAKPAEDAGSGSLTIEETGKPTVVVTYAVSRDEFRETDTGKMFFGGLTVQELLGEWNKYSYKVLGERAAGGVSGFEVEGKLKDGQKSVIASTKAVFDAQNYLPIETRLFDNAGKELRTYQKAEIKTAGGRAYIGKVEVVNHVYNSQIAVEILSREFPDKLDDAMFAREKLKQSSKK